MQVTLIPRIPLQCRSLLMPPYDKVGPSTDTHFVTTDCHKCGFTPDDCQSAVGNPHVPGAVLLRHRSTRKATITS